MYAYLQHLRQRRTILVGRKLVLFSARLLHVGKENKEAKWEEITIPSPWGNVAGKWWGSTASQPILCLHGWEDNAGSFDELAPHLNTSVLAIDLPGHGFSSHCMLGATYNFMDGVTLIRHIVRHFKWEDITIIGHSYGSLLSLAYSAFFPENVKNLIGIECVRAVIFQNQDSIAEDLKRTIDAALYMEERLSKKPPSYTINEMINMLQKGGRGPGPMSKKTCEIILKRGAKEIAEGKYLFARDPRLRELPLGRMTKDLLYAASSRISCNVLYILGNPGWHLSSFKPYYETFELMKKGAKKIEEHVVEGTHHVHLDNASKVAPIIKNFLSVS